MFTKCVKCEREGNDCILKLLLMPFPDIIKWCIQTQKKLGWSNQTMADKSHVPVGTINRIKAGEYADCKYSTIRSIILALLEGISADFPCPEIEPGMHHVLLLEQQAAKLTAVEAENKALLSRLSTIDEQHRADIRAVRAEYQAQKAEYIEQITFLKDELKAWRSWHQKAD